MGQNGKPRKEYRLLTALILLILGAFLGNLLAFLFAQKGKELEIERERKNAFMYLKIEMRNVGRTIDAISSLSRSDAFASLSKSGGPVTPPIPSTDFYEPSMAVQASQLIYFDEPLAEKVFNLSTLIKNLNKFRQAAYSLLGKPSDIELTSNYKLFLWDLDNAQHLLKEIDALIGFALPAELDQRKP